VDVEGKITIPLDSAGLIIGRGGLTVRAISEESGAKVTDCSVIIITVISVEIIITAILVVLLQ
jgi:hypothetical protein